MRPAPRSAPRRSGRGSPTGRGRRATRARSRPCGSCRGSGGCRRCRGRRRARPSRPAPSACARRGGRAAGGPASARSPRSSASSTSSSISAARIAGGFSTNTCLPASSACLRERVVGRHGRRDHDRLELGVGEHLLERAGRARAREAPRELRRGAPRTASQIQRRSARSSTLRTRFAPQAPSPTCADADAVAQSFQTLPSTSRPAGRVAEVDDDLRALDDVGVVDRRVRGHDRDAVVGLGLERRRASCRRTRATCGSW